MNVIRITNLSKEINEAKQIDVIYKVDSLKSDQDNITIFDIERSSDYAVSKGFDNQLPKTTTVNALVEIAKKADCEVFYNGETLYAYPVLPEG